MTNQNDSIENNLQRMPEFTTEQLEQRLMERIITQRKIGTPDLEIEKTSGLEFEELYSNLSPITKNFDWQFYIDFVRTRCVNKKIEYSLNDSIIGKRVEFEYRGNPFDSSTKFICTVDGIKERKLFGSNIQYDPNVTVNLDGCKLGAFYISLLDSFKVL